MNKKIANMIDHTILKATATKDDVVKLCNEAKEYGFFSVCINPANIELAKEELKGSNVKVCTVIGFPLGANTSAVKAFETKDAIAKGADEVDMVINIGALKDKNYELVYEDIKAVVDAANKEALVKVIIETCYLTEEEKIAMCKSVTDAGADYIKTSTGFGTGGATIEDIKLFKQHIGPNVKIKAAGGVKTVEDLEMFITEGCERIGTSSAINLIKGKEAQGY